MNLVKNIEGISTEFLSAQKKIGASNILQRLQSGKQHKRTNHLPEILSLKKRLQNRQKRLIDWKFLISLLNKRLDTSSLTLSLQEEDQKRKERHQDAYEDTKTYEKNRSHIKYLKKNLQNFQKFSQDQIKQNQIQQQNQREVDHQLEEMGKNQRKNQNQIGQKERKYYMMEQRRKNTNNQEQINQ